jgi:hypothetical protein
MSDNYQPFSEWDKREPREYPYTGVLYNWTRPGPLRDEMIKAKVIAKVNNRWLFSPAMWREHCANQFRNR